MTLEARQRKFVDPATRAAQRCRIVSASLDKDAIAAAVEELIEKPGWSAEFLDEPRQGQEGAFAEIGAVTLAPEAT